jgi:hypothetical protein
MTVRKFLEKKPEYEIKSVNSTTAETCLQLLIAVVAGDKRLDSFRLSGN